MRVFYHTAEAAGKIKNAVVTTGSFDGVHVGHKMIIGRLNEIAGEIDGESVLVTFYPHPRKVLYPDLQGLKMISSQKEKIELLRKSGLQNLVILPFSVEFSRTSSRDFVVNMLISHLQARVIVVGHNHHFGYARKGDYSYLHRLSQDIGFRVEEIPLQMIENETVSSTKIRKAIAEGNIQRANAYLDHQYIIIGDTYSPSDSRGLSGEQIVGMKITAGEKLIPPAGIYASNLVTGNKWMKSMTLITLSENGEPLIESQLLYDDFRDFGTEAGLYFYKRVYDGSTGANGKFAEEVIHSSRELVEELIY